MAIALSSQGKEGMLPQVRTPFHPSTFICSHRRCKQGFRSTHELFQHWGAHGRNCPWCNTSCSSKYNFERHWEATHVTPDNVPSTLACEICGRRYPSSRSWELRRHKKACVAGKSRKVSQEVGGKPLVPDDERHGLGPNNDFDIESLEATSSSTSRDLPEDSGYQSARDRTVTEFGGLDTRLNQDVSPTEQYSRRREDYLSSFDAGLGSIFDSGGRHHDVRESRRIESTPAGVLASINTVADHSFNSQPSSQSLDSVGHQDTKSRPAWLRRDGISTRETATISFADGSHLDEVLLSVGMCTPFIGKKVSVSNISGRKFALLPLES